MEEPCTRYLARISGTTMPHPLVFAILNERPKSSQPIAGMSVEYPPQGLGEATRSSAKQFRVQRL